MKKQRTFRFKPETIAQLKAMAKGLQITQTEFLERTIKHKGNARAVQRDIARERRSALQKLPPLDGDGPG